MPFTQATTEHLAKFDKLVDYTLELRNGFPEGRAWQAYPFETFSLTHDAGSGGEIVPATLRAVLCNDALAFSRETAPDCRTQLFAELRLTCLVDGESEVLFDGRIYRIEPEDYSFTIYAHDPLALVHECECELSLEPEMTAELAVRQLTLAGGGAFGSVYGFTYLGGADPAFNEDQAAGSRRRAWAPGAIRLWYDEATTLEVSPQHYQANLTSGVVSLLEDTAGKCYYVSGVRCYIEGTLDWSDVVRAALSYPQTAGGIGATEDELDCPATGLDIAGPLYFRGRVADLLREILARQQANLRLWYNSRAGVFTLRIVKQQQLGTQHWTLQHALSIAQPRELRDVYSRVVVSGLCERPRNALTESATSISGIATQGDWYGWHGVDYGWALAASAAVELLADGDYNMGCGVHHLAACEGGGTDPYNSWYNFVLIDLGQTRRITRVRAGLPSSRNINANNGHQGAFWPGLQVLGSVDGTIFSLLSPLLHGRFPPLHQLDVDRSNIVVPQARYIKVLLGAYKYGIASGNDPVIALSEFELYCTEEYRVVKEIDGNALPATYYSYTADYDRDGEVDSWPRNHAALWTRLDGRHRTLFDDQRGKLNEFLAHDRALDLLAESVRLFQQVRFQAVCDPRVRLYDTVTVPDALNGEVTGLLVERVVLSPNGAEISGTNYRIDAL
jgi:hypothetical protein